MFDESTLATNDTSADSGADGEASVEWLTDIDAEFDKAPLALPAKVIDLGPLLFSDRSPSPLGTPASPSEVDSIQIAMLPAPVGLGVFYPTSDVVKQQTMNSEVLLESREWESLLYLLLHILADDPRDQLSGYSFDDLLLALSLTDTRFHEAVTTLMVELMP